MSAPGSGQGAGASSACEKKQSTFRSLSTAWPHGPGLTFVRRVFLWPMTGLPGQADTRSGRALPAEVRRCAFILSHSGTTVSF